MDTMQAWCGWKTFPYGGLVRSAVAVALAGSAFAVSCAQQSCMAGMPMGTTQAMPGMQAVPPPEKLPMPIRMTGLGNAHIQIRATPEAQIWFDQGLNLMHDFWDYESAKAFEQGVRVDPNCAMCFWGLAEVEGFRGGPEKIYGTKALAEAVRLKKHASGAEKLYIEAAEASQQAKDDDNKAEVVILRKLVKKNPKDLQARILLATTLQDGYKDGEPKPGTKEAIGILEGALRDAPNDSAANHYWIHAIEPGNHPERAIPSSALLASLAPASGHMVHMPGHIYYRVGNYPEAERWFAASAKADETYMEQQHVSPDDDWNYIHNMMYGIANLMEEGKLAEANALSERLSHARGQLSATLYIWSARDQMARVSERLPVALRVGDWKGMLTMLDSLPPNPVRKAGQVDKTENLRFLTTELHHFATGMEALEQNDVPDAVAASARMDAGLWRTEQRTAEEENEMKAKGKDADAAAKAGPPMIPILPDAMAGPMMASMAIESLELRAGIMIAEGRVDEAKELYLTAAAKEKDLGYHEPPFSIRPVAETEAAALIKAKDYVGAKSAYEAALVARPGSGFPLYGLARVKELSGDQAGARTGYAAFLKAWPDANADLPEVLHARVVTSLPAVASR